MFVSHRGKIIIRYSIHQNEKQQQQQLNEARMQTRYLICSHHTQKNVREEEKEISNTVSSYYNLIFHIFVAVVVVTWLKAD